MLIEGRPLETPSPPLQDLLGSGVADAPAEPAVVAADQRMSWRELEAASSTLAAAYRALGLETASSPAKDVTG